MKLLKHTTLLILLSLVCSFANANEYSNEFDSANTAYTDGNYIKAITLYEGIINNNLEASEVYYNLGNCYYKTNNLAQSILNYERAKKLDPNNEDILFNLKLANKKTEDKIDVIPQLFLSQWKSSFVHLMTEKKWSILLIFSFIIGLLLFTLYITSSNRIIKQFGFFGGSIVFILSIFLFFTAKQKYQLTKSSTEAIIVSSSVRVSGSPTKEGTQIFIIHECTKVDVNKVSEHWTEIKIANGSIGWIENENLEAI